MKIRAASMHVMLPFPLEKMLLQSILHFFTWPFTFCRQLLWTKLFGDTTYSMALSN